MTDTAFLERHEESATVAENNGLYVGHIIRQVRVV